MSYLLQPGQIVDSQSGQTCKIKRYLGGGGQGEVYSATWAGRDVALKWYYEQSATPEQHQVIADLVAQGAPSDAFLWPEDLATARGVRGFGYIMRLRPPEYRSLNDFVAGRINPSALALVNFGIELAKAMRALHSRGLCYRDISFGNAFFNEKTGAVLVCDNDNVTTNRSTACGVLGTPDFMAPELVRREPGARPSTLTDLHSLAVLLFYSFFLGHPLSGRKILGIRCWDAPARELLFGREPVFIFDPQNPANAAVDLSVDPTGEAGGWARTYWEQVYPESFRATFVKAFTRGLADPNSRVTELEWLDSLTQLRDAHFRCACGTPNYYDRSKVAADGSYQGRCWSCGTPARVPFRARIGKSLVMLNADTRLYPHHMHNGRDFDFSAPVAEISRHPTDPNIWGLKNLGADKWVTTLPNGVTREVEPGRSVPLAANTRVRFGTVEGEVLF